MTDKELLELAAKAAEIEGRWIDGFDHLGICISKRGLPIKLWWNPLGDDGDAFRLAVKLDISTRQQFALIQAEYPWIEDCCTRKILCEAVLNDYCAATRRAIVRAAAEIGRNMP